MRLAPAPTLKCSILAATDCDWSNQILIIALTLKIYRLYDCGFYDDQLLKKLRNFNAIVL